LMRRAASRTSRRASFWRFLGALAEWTTRFKTAPG
jgi:hypothetical protein